MDPLPTPSLSLLPPPPARLVPPRPLNLIVLSGEKEEERRDDHQWGLKEAKEAEREREGGGEGRRGHDGKMETQKREKS